jgi:hypothetical protein
VPETPQENTGSGVRIYWLVSIAAIVVALGYVGFVFWSRAQQNRAFARRAAAEAAQKRAEDEKTFESMGGNRFAILAFGATPAVISPGEESQLCYSVSNAKSVKLDPPVGDVWPSNERCISVSPHKTTTYTLTIADAAGRTKSAATRLEVR